jgi:hypothetical protein
VNELITKSAPIRPNDRAIPKPIPDVDPVMIARFPDNCIGLSCDVMKFGILVKTQGFAQLYWPVLHCGNGNQRRHLRKKKRLQKQAQVIEAGFIQARNLSSSDYFISLSFGISKLKV